MTIIGGVWVGPNYSHSIVYRPQKLLFFKYLQTCKFGDTIENTMNKKVGFGIAKALKSRRILDITALVPAGAQFPGC